MEDNQAMAEANGTYVVGDIIALSFPGMVGPTISAIQERIKEDGTITLPLIGSVKAAGKTPAELQMKCFTFTSRASTGVCPIRGQTGESSTWAGRCVCREGKNILARLRS